MEDSIAYKKIKPLLFQVLLLDNNASDDVKVQEAERVDFFQVKKHLKKGGSVFITSKDSQKLCFRKNKTQLSYNKSKRNYGAIFRRI